LLSSVSTPARIVCQTTKYTSVQAWRFASEHARQYASSLMTPDKKLDSRQHRTYAVVIQTVVKFLRLKIQNIRTANLAGDCFIQINRIKHSRAENHA
jgi:hypothetical protein